MRIWQAGKKRQAATIQPFTDTERIKLVADGFVKHMERISIDYSSAFNSLRFNAVEPVFKKGQPLKIGNEIVIVAKDAYGERGTIEVFRT